MSPVSTPLVSVVVVNWNRKQLLQKSLESLAGQRGPEFEVIVVDNGSTDSSLTLIEEVRRSAPFPLTLVANPDNRGFCAANNQGIALARGEFVALLNNDAEADPGWLAALTAAFDGRPGVGMAASKILVWDDPAKIDKAGHLMYPDGQNRGRGSGQVDRGQFDREEEVLWPDGCAAMYRSAMLREIGGFDEDFFAYADDAELGLRARIAGWSCLYTPCAVVRHHRGATLGIQSGTRLELIERNRILLAAKLFPWSLLCLNGAYFLARVGAGLWAAARGRGEVGRFPGWREKLGLVWTIVKADFQAMRMLPRMLRKRREIRPIRRLNSSEVRKLLLRHRISLREITEQAV